MTLRILFIMCLALCAPTAQALLELDANQLAGSQLDTRASFIINPWVDAKGNKELQLPKIRVNVLGHQTRYAWTLPQSAGAGYGGKPVLLQGDDIPITPGLTVTTHIRLSSSGFVGGVFGGAAGRGDTGNSTLPFHLQAGIRAVFDKAVLAEYLPFADKETNHPLGISFSRKEWSTDERKGLTWSFKLRGDELEQTIRVRWIVEGNEIPEYTIRLVKAQPTHYRYADHLTTRPAPARPAPAAGMWK